MSKNSDSWRIPGLFSIALLLFTTLLVSSCGGGSASPSASAANSPGSTAPGSDTPSSTILISASGWQLTGYYAAAYASGTDTAATYQGQPSAYLKSIADDICQASHQPAGANGCEGFGGLGQSLAVDQYRGKRIRFSAFVKSEDVDKWAGLWLRADKGSSPVAFDSMQFRSNLKGTMDWQACQLVLDVPADSTIIYLGMIMAVHGKAWVSGAKVEVVSSDVPLTGGNSTTPGSAGSDAESRTVVVDGVSRSFRLYVPAKFTAGSSGLVVLLHGSGGTGIQVEQYTNMNAKADQEGFAVAYPDGLVAPAARISEWHNYFDDVIWAPQTSPDDIAFMRALVSAITAEIHPDSKKIYFAGISNGGLFAHRIGVEMPDVAAAVGIVEGTLFGFSGDLQKIPPAKGPVSVLILHGDADTAIPYCSTTGIASQEQTFNYWVQTPSNQCRNVSPSAPLCDALGSITSVDEKQGSECSGEAEVRFYRLRGGVHNWYSSPMNTDGVAPYNPNFNSATGVTTNDILWNFFVAHPKP